MVWVMVALMLGGFVYAVAVIAEYRAFLGEMQPRIERARGRAEDFDEKAEKEAAIRDQIRARLEPEKKMVEELKAGNNETKRKLQEAKQHEEELEMQMYKQQFKQSKKNA